MNRVTLITVLGLLLIGITYVLSNVTSKTKQEYFLQCYFQFL